MQALRIWQKLFGSKVKQAKRTSFLNRVLSGTHQNQVLDHRNKTCGLSTRENYKAFYKIFTHFWTLICSRKSNWNFFFCNRWLTACTVCKIETKARNWSIGGLKRFISTDGWKEVLPDFIAETELWSESWHSFLSVHGLEKSTLVLWSVYPVSIPKLQLQQPQMVKNAAV